MEPGWNNPLRQGWACAICRSAYRRCTDSFEVQVDKGFRIFVSPAQRRKPMRIGIVDDDRLVCTSLQTILDRSRG